MDPIFALVAFVLALALLNLAALRFAVDSRDTDSLGGARRTWW